MHVFIIFLPICHMKGTIFLAIIFASSHLFGQSQRHTLSSQGGVYQTQSKTIVSQSIGQGSVIGHYASESSQTIQGFQQPLWDGLIMQNELPLDITISPNPFVEQVMLAHSEDTKMRVTLFDVSGKLIYNNTIQFKAPYQYLNFSGLAVGAYLVSVKANGLSYYTKLLKE